MSKTAEVPVAVKVRELILANPDKTNAELHAKWDGRPIKESVIRNGRSFIKKKFGELVVSKGQVSKSAVVRHIIGEHPDWSDSHIMEYMAENGLETTRGCVSSAKSVATNGRNGRKKKAKNVPQERGNRSGLIRAYLAKHPKASPKDVVAALAESGEVVSLGLVSVIKYSKKNKKNSPDKNQNAGPRAKKGETSASFDNIEQKLEELMQEADELGNSQLANSIRQARRMASAAIVSTY